MLRSLTIKNFALIEEFDVSFNDGFTAITGETGAGKSILLGAFSLILGGRADSGMLFDASKKCIVEGCFDISKYRIETFFVDNDIDYYDSLTLRREISPDGRSRAFVNDSPANLSILKQLGEFLIDIHSQHKTISLNDIDYQLELIDSYAVIGDKVKNYKCEYATYKSMISSLVQLQQRERDAIKERDYLQFLYDELETAKLKEGEKEALENELRILSNAEGIKVALQSSIDAIDNGEYSVLSGVNNVRKGIRDVVKLYGESVSQMSERIESAYIELKDIASELVALDDKVVFDQTRIVEVSERLDVLNNLEQKHRVQSDKELVLVFNEIGYKLNSITSISDDIAELKQQFDLQKSKITLLADELTKLRIEAIREIEKELISIIIRLGMPDASFKVEHNKLNDFTSSGVDSVVFRFNANKGGELKDISKIASGGEMSRLMLAVKSIISRKKQLPSIVFDEIDTGVSGDIAAKMGVMMSQMSNSMQVIVITHLPQVASKATTHFYVYKDRTNSKTSSLIRELDSNQRVEEIAKMLSGENITPAAIANAKELIMDKKE